MSTSTLSDFEFLQQLGKGSYGTVFKVRRKVDNLIYVLKQICLSPLSAREQQECISECRLLASVDSVHVVRYYDSFVDSSTATLNIVMEYCSRGDLHALLKSRTSPLTEEQCWKYLLHACVGLFHLHSRHILHRDIKTANLFLTENDELKIGDLGVAKMLSSSMSCAKTTVGTPYYLSPELAEGKRYGPKSDVWAIGSLTRVVLYEMLTLRRPFSASNQGALILRILRGTYAALPPPLRNSELNALLQACLRRDAQLRPTVRQILTSAAAVQWAHKLGMRELLPEEAQAQTQMLTNERGGATAAAAAGEKRRKPPLPAAATAHAHTHTSIDADAHMHAATPHCASTPAATATAVATPHRSLSRTSALRPVRSAAAAAAAGKKRRMGASTLSAEHMPAVAVIEGVAPARQPKGLRLPPLQQQQQQRQQQRQQQTEEVCALPDFPRPSLPLSPPASAAAAKFVPSPDSDDDTAATATAAAAAAKEKDNRPNVAMFKNALAAAPIVPLQQQQQQQPQQSQQAGELHAALSLSPFSPSTSALASARLAAQLHMPTEVNEELVDVSNEPVCAAAADDGEEEEEEEGEEEDVWNEHPHPHWTGSAEEVQWRLIEEEHALQQQQQPQQQQQWTDDADAEEQEQQSDELYDDSADESDSAAATKTDLQQTFDNLRVSDSTTAAATTTASSAHTDTSASACAHAHSTTTTTSSTHRPSSAVRLLRAVSQRATRLDSQLLQLQQLLLSPPSSLTAAEYKRLYAYFKVQADASAEEEEEEDPNATYPSSPTSAAAHAHVASSAPPSDIQRILQQSSLDLPTLFCRILYLEEERNRCLAIVEMAQRRAAEAEMQATNNSEEKNMSLPLQQVSAANNEHHNGSNTTPRLDTAAAVNSTLNTTANLTLKRDAMLHHSSLADSSNHRKL